MGVCLHAYVYVTCMRACVHACLSEAHLCMPVSTSGAAGAIEEAVHVHEGHQAVMPRQQILEKVGKLARELRQVHVARRAPATHARMHARTQAPRSMSADLTGRLSPSPLIRTVGPWPPAPRSASSLSARSVALCAYLVTGLAMPMDWRYEPSSCASVLLPLAAVSDDDRRLAVLT
jgi:hypothetical protein